MNQFGNGNSVARHARRLRQLAVEAATEQDIRDIVARLVMMARAGGVATANLLLIRALRKHAVADTFFAADDLGPVTLRISNDTKRHS